MKIVTKNSFESISLGDVLNVNGKMFMIILDEMSGEYLALNLKNFVCECSDLSIQELAFELGKVEHIHKKEYNELILG